jgi:hypothetical protein
MIWYIRDDETKMPDGFDPHTELARIYTLRELMTECRQRTHVVLQNVDEMFADPTLSHGDRIKLMEFVTNRAYGKPRQTVYISDETGPNQSSSRVKVYLPDNGRMNTPVKTIDSEAA